MIQFDPEIAILLVLQSNSVEFTTDILNRIKEVEPRRLYLVHNTAKTADEHDELGIFLEEAEIIDWPCTVNTLYRPFSSRNRMVREAVSWFFGAESKGIVLDNRSMPSVDFFGFCSELLKKYENDDRISHISGVNKHQNLTKNKRESYYFSALTNTQVWASWQRSVKEISMNGCGPKFSH